MNDSFSHNKEFRLKYWTFQVNLNMEEMGRHKNEWLMVKAVYFYELIGKQKTYFFFSLCAGQKGGFYMRLEIMK